MAHCLRIAVIAAVVGLLEAARAAMPERVGEAAPLAWLGAIVIIAWNAGELGRALAGLPRIAGAALAGLAAARLGVLDGEAIAGLSPVHDVAAGCAGLATGLAVDAREARAKATELALELGTALHAEPIPTRAIARLFALDVASTMLVVLALAIAIERRPAAPLVIAGSAFAGGLLVRRLARSRDALDAVLRDVALPASLIFGALAGASIGVASTPAFAIVAAAVALGRGIATACLARGLSTARAARSRRRGDRRDP